MRGKGDNDSDQLMSRPTGSARDAGHSSAREEKPWHRHGASGAQRGAAQSDKWQPFPASPTLAATCQGGLRLLGC